jgi:hypothetical protein
MSLATSPVVHVGFEAMTGWAYIADIAAAVAPRCTSMGLGRVACANLTGSQGVFS